MVSFTEEIIDLGVDGVEVSIRKYPKRYYIAFSWEYSMATCIRAKVVHDKYEREKDIILSKLRNILIRQSWGESNNGFFHPSEEVFTDSN